MRAITIKAPWTVPILSGAKTVENRRQPTEWRGPLAIHVSRSWCPIGAADPRVRLAAYLAPAVRDIALTIGAVIAIADLTDCHRATDDCCPTWGDRDCWHLVLRQVRRLPHPLPARGSLGVWTPNPVLASAIRMATQ